MKSKYKDAFSVGDLFGRWSIINTDIIMDREAKVLCKCECGTECIVSCYTLIKGTSTQCTICGNSLKGDNNPAWLGYKNIPHRNYGRIKRNAESRDIEFDLDIEFINDLLVSQDFKCALSGVSIDILNTETASLDRIDNTKGYIIGNIQWVHKHINFMKRNHTQDYFIELCGNVYKHNK